MDAQVLDHYLRFLYFISNAPTYLYDSTTLLFSHASEMDDIDPLKWEGTDFHPLKLLENEQTVGYHTSHNLIAAGFVKDKASKLSVVIGPFRLANLSDVTMQQMAFEETIPLTQLQDIFQYLRRCPQVTLETLFWYLSALNMTMNHEIWNPREGLLSTAFMDASAEQSHTFREQSTAFSEVAPQLAYDYEVELLHYLEEGDTTNLMEWWNYSHRTDRSVGHLHGRTESMRNWNRFVMSASVISRAAMRGGLPPEMAMPLFDYYLDLAEREPSFNTLDDMTAKMLYDFSERVRKTKQMNTGNTKVNQAMRYIVEHIDTPLTVREIAAHVDLTPEYLAKCFKENLGITVSAYIRNWRIHRAKRLLKFTERSLAEIAAYLCFSSQSHFQSIFKKTTGMTPQEYRRKRQDE